MHPVSIRNAVNGHIVTVGCVTFVFNDLEELMRELRRYLTDPQGAQKTWEGKIKEFYRGGFDAPEEEPREIIRPLGSTGGLAQRPDFAEPARGCDCERPL